MRPFQTYPGGKGGSGVAQQIISLMPKHRTYVELFVGGGAIYRVKRPAEKTILCDLDPDVVREWCGGADSLVDEASGIEIHRADALHMSLWPVSLLQATHDRETLVYADPPYLGSARGQNRAIYKHEMLSEADHEQLLDLLLALPCRVMISGYFSLLYAAKLKGWEKRNFPGPTRQGWKIEYVWMNFTPELHELHDTRFIGSNRREREKIKRMKETWVRRFRDMPANKRQAIREALDSCETPVIG